MPPFAPASLFQNNYFSKKWNFSCYQNQKSISYEIWFQRYDISKWKSHIFVTFDNTGAKSDPESSKKQLCDEIPSKHLEKASKLFALCNSNVKISTWRLIHSKSKCYFPVISLIFDPLNSWSAWSLIPGTLWYVWSLNFEFRVQNFLN